MQPQATGVSPRLIALPGIAAVVFDVYGTLFQSSSGDVGTAAAVDRPQSVAAALAAAGAPVTPVVANRLAAAFPEAVRGDHAVARRHGVDHPEVDAREIWQQILAEAGVAGGAPLAERVCVEFEARHNPVWPMPGAGEVLARLGQRYTTGIVSNAQFYTELMFTALVGKTPAETGLTCVVWSFQQRRAKPSLQLFAMASRQLARDRRIGPSQCLYVGNDMLNDIWPAARAGWRTALFAGDARSLRRRTQDPRCRGVDPDVVVTSLTQLGEILLN